MNEFIALRTKAREKRDRIIHQARREYAETLIRIAALADHRWTIAELMTKGGGGPGDSGVRRAIRWQPSKTPAAGGVPA